MPVSRSPELGEVINRGFDIRLARLFSSRVGVITKYDAATQLASVQPQLKEVYEGNDGEPALELLPVIQNVPVFFAGGGGFAATFPIADGDECDLVFNDRSLDLWKEQGGNVDPIDLRRHALTDAVAFVGVRSKPNKLSEVDTARAVFGKQGGPRVAVSDSLVHLGVGHNEDAPHFVALENLVKQEISALRDYVNQLVITLKTHLHGPPTVVSPQLALVLPPNPVQDVAATKVKAK